jgi:hypothetical protein
METLEASLTENNTAVIQDDDGGWTKHSAHHWSRLLKGKRLDYWPSKTKWQYEGKVKKGDVLAFVRRKS